MFGFRPDGRRVAQEDAILEIIPYLMPTRVDSQVAITLKIDCDILTKYIREQRDKGNIITYMDLIIAAYVRTITQHPDLNRFVVNKRLYARNSICVSMALLKNFGDSDKIQESTIKLTFPPESTVYDVHEILQNAIEKNRKPEVANATDKVLSVVLKIPLVPMIAVGLFRLLDRYGLLPKIVQDIIPFHTGLFITNMASLGLPQVNHHIYNFGTTSIFLAMGKTERTPVPAPGGTVRIQRVIPIGIVSDERITSGAEYGRAFSAWRDLLAKPEQLETPPTEVKVDFPPEKMPGYRRNQRRLRRAAKREAQRKEA